jgi:MoxR-like ATPase
MSENNLPASVDEVLKLLASQQYVAERHLATTLFLAMKMGRPLFLEGEAGVGKTEIAKVLAAGLGRKLVRLQCYEGLDISSAVYEWNYPRQMIEIRLAEAAGQASKDQLATDIFTDRFLIKRPLLQALENAAGGAPILLIDELDRTDEPFEAYLLEMLAEYQVSIPEIGTIKAAEPPLVIITSNRTREIHDAVKRRCFYHWVDYPDKAREFEIIRRKVPQAAETLSRQVVLFIARLRQMELYKLPGVAETIDWTASLCALDKLSLDPESVTATLGVVLKYQDDIGKLDGAAVTQMVQDVRDEASNSR